MTPISIMWIFGIIFGILTTLIIIKSFNKDGKVRTKYDERQLRARGEAYKYGFFATAIACFIFMILQTTNLANIFGYSSYFTAVIIGIITQFSYAIFHDAYIGLNTNMKKYLIFMSVVAIINLAAGILPAIHGELLEDGQLGTSFINLLCGGMFLILAGELAIKNHLDKKAN